VLGLAWWWLCLGLSARLAWSVSSAWPVSSFRLARARPTPVPPVPHWHVPLFGRARSRTRFTRGVHERRATVPEGGSALYLLQRRRRAI